MSSKFVFPVIILVEPQLAVNVGMIARTMLNFNFTQLRIVNPRDKEVIKNSLAASCGADIVLNKCVIYSSLNKAVEDLQLVYATSNRVRYMHKPILSLENIFTNLPVNFNKYSIAKIGFLFGKESSGLSNNDLNYANVLIKINTNSDFGSLNIVQAVALVCYVCNNAICEKDGRESLSTSPLNELATFGEMEYFFNYIESFLVSHKFFPPDKKATMVRNFRNIFLRNGLTKSELKSLFRITKELIKAKKS